MPWSRGYQAGLSMNRSGSNLHQVLVFYLQVSQRLLFYFLGYRILSSEFHDSTVRIPSGSENEILIIHKTLAHGLPLRISPRSWLHWISESSDLCETWQHPLRAQTRCRCEVFFHELRQ